MSDRINLEKIAENTISEAIYGLTIYNDDELRDAVQDRIHEEAENACTYHHHCAQIIQDYEREYGDAAEDMGGEYKAHQWREAMEAYACGIAHAALSSMVGVALNEIEEAADELEDLCRDKAGDAWTGDLVVSADCPHGWAPHDREDSDGTHYWSPAHLEGCHAIARQVSGVWLSFTWTPTRVVAC